MYTKDQPFVVDTPDDAAQILHYFHDFHDGFIKRISLESLDYFHEKTKGDVMSRSMTLTGEFQLKIDIAHYNYGAGEIPFNRGVCLLFDEFYDLDLKQMLGPEKDWMINEISFDRISRPLDTDAAYSEQLFQFCWKKPVYSHQEGWSENTLNLFTFSKALIWEDDWH